MASYTNKKLWKSKFGHVVMASRQPRQCSCAWCGARFIESTDCLTDSEREFLREFARDHGDKWKVKLKEIWANGDGVPDCMRILDKLGWNWLTWFKWPRVVEVDEAVNRMTKVIAERSVHDSSN